MGGKMPENKKIEPPTKEEYEREFWQWVWVFTPKIFACKKCGWPVATGYCCNKCGDTNPYEE